MIDVQRWMRNEEGSALIEVALALPVLLVLFAGLVDFGMYQERKMQVTEAANAAAGFGAQGNNQLNASGMRNAATAASPSLTNLSVTASSFWTCTPGGSQVTSSTSCGSSGNPLQYVQVQTSATVNAPLPLASLGSNMLLQGQATYRVRWKPS